MDASAAEPRLGDEEGLAASAEHVVLGDPNLVVANVCVRTIFFTVVAEGHVANDFDARRLGGDDEHRHLLVGRVVGVGHRHDDEERGETGVGGEPLLAVDDPLVAVGHRLRGEHFGVGAALRLGHREARHDLVIQQRTQIALFLLRCAVVSEDLGIARVRRLTPEDDRRSGGPTEDLVHQRQLHLAVPLTAELGSEVAGPQAALAHLRLQRRDELLADRILDVVGMSDHEAQRLDLVGDELFDPVEFLLELGIGLEIPRHGGPRFSVGGRPAGRKRPGPGS